jgi:hypothetical protein
LASLKISGNYLGKGWEASNDISALVTAIGQTTSLTELDISSNYLNAEDAKVLAAAIEASGSLSSLTFSGAKSRDDDGCGPWIDGDPVTINTTMIEADFSGKGLGHAGGAQILAAFMSTKLFQDMGSLFSANLLGNNIGVEQAQELVKIKEAKPGLKTLCGFMMEETEVDLSGKNLQAEDAILIASDISDTGSLSKLIFSGDHWQSTPVTVEVGMTEADFSGAKLQQSGAIILAAWLKHKVQHDDSD